VRRLLVVCAVTVAVLLTFGAAEKGLAVTALAAPGVAARFSSPKVRAARRQALAHGGASTMRAATKPALPPALRSSASFSTTDTIAAGTSAIRKLFLSLRLPYSIPFSGLRSGASSITTVTLDATAVVPSSTSSSTSPVAAVTTAPGGTAAAPASDPSPKTIVVADGVSARTVALNSRAAVYLTSSDTPNRVFTLSKSAAFPSGIALTPIAGNGQAGSLGDGGAAVAAQLDLSLQSLFARSGVAITTDGTIFIADSQNSTIRSIAGAGSSEPGVIRSVAGRWAPQQNVTLSEPMGIVIDRAGNLYIADQRAGAVIRMQGGSDQLTVLAHVVSPASVAITQDGSQLFVASAQTGAIFSIKMQTQAIATVPGFAPIAPGPVEAGSSSATAASGGVCAAAQAAAAQGGATGSASGSGASTSSKAASEQVCPAGIAVDGGGNLFVADANSGKILRVDAASNKTTTAASDLSIPGAIQFDANGNLYAAEQGRTRVIELAGLGDPASVIALSPAAAGFPTVAVGGTSPTQTFTLANNSANALSGVTVTMAGANPADFTIESTTCTAALAASSTCTISAASTPTAIGSRSATLTVTDSTPSDLATASLYTLALTPASATFENVPTGGTSPSQTFTLTNSSPTSLTGVTIAFNPPTTPGNFTQQSTSCTTMLAANSTCAITVAFTPQTTGSLSSALTVSETGGASTSATMSANGDDFSLQFASGQPQEITILQGGSGTINGFVQPAGAFGQNGEKVTFVCPTNLPINTSCAITPCPAAITVGANTPFQITFVTSTDAKPAPVPTGGCSSYGPPPTAWLMPGPGIRGSRGDGRPGAIESAGSVLAFVLPREPFAWEAARFPALMFTTQRADGNGDNSRGDSRAASRAFASPIFSFGLLALLAVGTLLACGICGMVGSERQRLPLLVGVSVIAFTGLVGCHHKSGTTVFPGTPTGTTTMVVTGNAVDASGNSLKSSRTIQFIVQVSPK
jgi:sugar lactone lactonase YvrE